MRGTLSGELSFTRRADKAKANLMMELLALDLDAGTPGVREVDGWKLDCYILTADAPSYTSANRLLSVSIFAPDPIWRRETRYEGSSPRMRGTHGEDNVKDEGGGIIPAYAGNTVRRMKAVAARGDHPRVCGEHDRSMPIVTNPMGSSPRMRGTQQSGHD